MCVCTGVVTDQKANATLTELNLCYNKVRDAGAAALADALKATVLTCKKCVFRACVRCHRKCRFTESSEELASSTCCAVCVAGFVIFCGLKGKVYSCLCRGNCARVVLKVMWHCVRTKQECMSSELQTERSPLALAWLQSATTSCHQDCGTEHDVTAQNAP